MSNRTLQLYISIDENPTYKIIINHCSLDDIIIWCKEELEKNNYTYNFGSPDGTDPWYQLGHIWFNFRDKIDAIAFRLQFN